MNVDKQKIALALRMLAEAFEDDVDAEEATPAPAPKIVPRRPRTLVAPAGVADEVTMARAARVLRDRGYRRTGT